MPKPRLKQLKDVGDASASVEYQRRDEAELLVSEANVVKTVVDDALNRPKSMALFWSLPGPVTTERGNLVAMSSCHVVIVNDSPAVTFVRVERPLGFESDPTGFALWESLVKGGSIRLLPAESRSINFGFPANNFVVPKREFVGGEDCVHLLSLSATRNALSVAGVDLQSPEQVALRIKVSLVYTSDGQAMGRSKAYVVRSYGSANHMDYTNYPPPPAVSVGQLRCREGQVNWARFENAQANGTLGKNGDPCPVVLKVSHDGGTHKHTEVDGLDETVLYAFDAPYTCYSCVEGTLPVTVATAYTTNARYLWYGDPSTKEYALQKGWYLCVAEKPLGADKNRLKALAYFLDEATGGALNLGININFLREPANQARLSAVTNQLKPVTVRGKYQLRNEVRQYPKPRAAMLEGPGWIDKVVEAATVVIKVVKVAVDVASVIAAVTLIDDPREDKAESEASFVMASGDNDY